MLCICQSILVLVQSETNIVLNECVIIFLRGSHDLGCLVQYFYLMNGRIQRYLHIKL